jgi:hypothetical protein
MDLAFFVNNHYIALFIDMFFLRRVSDDFESVLIIKHSLTILLSHLIPALVVRLTIYKHVPVLVKDAVLTVNNSNLLA